MEIFYTLKKKYFEGEEWKQGENDIIRSFIFEGNIKEQEKIMNDLMLEVENNAINNGIFSKINLVRL